jgi:uncharacterized protein (DUF433 family)
MACDEDEGVCGAEPPAIIHRGGRPCLLGTHYSVRDVVRAQQQHPSPAVLARRLGLSRHQVRTALEYYERHPDEIDDG